MTKETTEQDVERRLKTFKEEDFVSDRNYRLVKEFIESLQADKEKAGYWRQRMYISKFSVALEKYIDEETYEETDFDKLTHRDMTRLISALGRDKADRTLNAYKSCFRMFYKNRFILEKDRPDNVKRIFQTGIIKHDSKPEDVKTKNILEPEEIWTLVEVARNPRSACLPIMGLDCGARTKELNSVTLGDISIHPTCADVEFIDCKNGKPNRTLPLTHCVEQLRNWLQHHPNDKEENPDAPLWCKIRDYKDGKRGEALSQKSLNNILKKLGRRAKKKYPDQFDWLDPETLTVYDLRHSSIEFRKVTKNYGTGKLQWFYAWKNSDMISHYGQEKDERYNRAIKQEEGVYQGEEDDFSHSMQSKHCPRCKEERSADAKYCPECSLAIETDTAIKESKLREAGRQVMAMKLDDEIEAEDIEEVLKEVKA